MSKAIYIKAITNALPLLTIDELDKIRAIIFDCESYEKACETPTGEEDDDEGIDLVNGYGFH